MATKQLYTFQVLHGEHQGNRRKYVKGEIFQSCNPLDEMFVGKFQRLPNKPTVIDDDTTETVPPALRERKVHIPEGQVRDQFPFTFTEATNVTYMFPDAEKAGLAVYKDSLGGFAVAIADAKVKTNLARQILGSKKKVQQFLDAFISTTAEETDTDANANDSQDDFND